MPRYVSADFLALEDGRKIPLSAITGLAGIPNDELPTNVALVGQSNMVSEPPLDYGFSALVPLLGSDLTGWNQVSGGFATLLDRGADSASSVSGAIGAGQLGTRLLRDIATLKGPGTTMRCFAAARAGQPLSYFRKGSATKHIYANGTQHATLNTYELMRTSVVASGIALQWIVFCQGEANGSFSQAEYYAEFEPYVTDELFADFPNVKIAVIGTIGDANGRLGGTSGYLLAPFRAQKQVVDENPTRMIMIDNRDMSGVTSMYDAPTSAHYSFGGGSYGGFKECSRRVLAGIRGVPARPAVERVPRIHDALAWTVECAYRHGIITTNGRNEVTNWQSDVGAASLVNEGAEGGTQISADASFGSVTSIDLNASNSERYVTTSIAGGNQWTIHVPALYIRKSSLGGTPRTLWQIEPFGSGTPRIGLTLYMPPFAGKPSFFDNTNDFAFTNAPTLNQEISCSVGCVYDGTAGTAKLYLDGALVDTLSGLANISIDPAKIRVGSFSGSQFFDGRLTGFYAAPIAATDAQMLAAHEGGRVEYELST